MLDGVVPADKRVFIRASQRGCIVARYIQTASFEFEVQYAANWLDLQPQARRAVEQIAGAITEFGRYPCPPELAALAVWPD